jgi:hypothetical protein
MVSAHYEEHYRWTPNTVAGTAVCAAFLLAAIIVPAMPLAVRVPLALAAIAGGVSCVAYSTSRKVALRVDHKGVTLGGGPFRYKAKAAFFPWEDIDTVVLWWRRSTVGSVRYVSVQRRKGVPPMSPGGTGVADQPAFFLSPRPRNPAPQDLKVGGTRGMVAFRVDDTRLATAIARFAPAVLLVKLP